MKTPVLIGLSPNTEADDIRLALKTLVRPWRWYAAPYVQELERELSHFFLGREAIAVSSGRAALFQALRAVGVTQGDEVIVQALTCVSVPAAVTWTGATPIYADIDPSTYTIDPTLLAARISPATKAIVFQHTFGNGAHLAKILEIARAHNLLLIEDCAHALGSVYEGKPAGTLGDIAVISFGRDKSISSVFGGAIMTGDRALASNIRQALTSLKMPPWRWVQQQLLHPILFSLIKPLYFQGQLGKVLLVTFQRLGFLSKAVTTEERVAGQALHTTYRYVPALAALALHQLRKLDRFTEHRMAVVRRYNAAGITSINAGERISWLRYPVRSTNPPEVYTDAVTRRILLGDWYRAAVFPAESYKHIHYVPGSCPQAEQAAAEIINLPTYPTLTTEEIERVIAVVRSHLKKQTI